MIFRVGDWRPRGPRRSVDRAGELRRRFARVGPRQISARAALRVLAPYLVIGTLVAIGVLFGDGFTRRADGSAVPEAIRGGTRSDFVVTGRAAVIDGDTIAIGRRHIRLDGIDAPEMAQLCEGPRGRYACGEEAKRALGALAGQDTVECRAGAVDAYKRFVAVCTVNGRDLGAAMVLAGWALAARGRPGIYAVLEREARAAERGLWQGKFQPPADWRRDHQK